MPTVEYNLNVDADNLIAGFEAAARVMATAQKEARELEKEEKRLEKATRDAAKAAKAAEVNLEGLAAGAQALHPQLGNLVRNFDDLGRGSAEVVKFLGTAGVAAGAVVTVMAALAVGTAAAAVGAFKLAGAAVEAVDRLDDMALAALIPDEARASIDAYEQAQTTLKTVVDELVISLGSDLAPTLVDLTLGTAAVIQKTIEYKDSIYETVDAIVWWQKHTNPFLAAAYAAWGLVADGAAEYADELDAIPLIFGPTPEQLGEVEKSHREAAAEASKRAAAEAKRAAAAKKIADDELAALKAIEAANKAAAAAANKYTAERNAEQAKWIKEKLEGEKALLAAEETARKERKAAADKEAADLAEKEKKKRDQINAGILEGVTGTVQAIADIASAQTEARLEELDVRAQRSQDREDDLREQLRASHDLTAGQRADIQAQIKAEDERQKKIAEKRRKAANDAKAAAISQAIIGASLAIVQCFAQLGPIGGAIAAVPTGVATAAEIATISKQKFHDGGSLGQGPDEFNVGGGQTGRAGEVAVAFNQRATEQGAARVAEEMNRTGNVPGGPGGSYELHLDGRSVGNVVIRESRKAGTPFTPRNDGSSNPFRRG